MCCVIPCPGNVQDGQIHGDRVDWQCQGPGAECRQWLLAVLGVSLGWWKCLGTGQRWWPHSTVHVLDAAK